MTAEKDIPPDDLAREQVRRHLEQLHEAAPKSLAAHATLLHKTESGRAIVPARHHMEWVRMLEDRDNYRWLVVVAPPGSAKSTWFSVIYPCWRIGQSAGRVRFGLVSNTASLTYGFARSIQRTIADPRYKHVYGQEPDPSRGWSQAQMWVNGSRDSTNPNLLSSGIGGPLQGKRFDEIILDDPTTWDEARSLKTMEDQRHWLKALLIQRFPPGMGPPDGDGRMVVVMTRWGENDLIPTFVDMGFQVVTMPALGYWDRTDLGEGRYEWGNEPLWPEKQSRESLEHEREENEIVFELVMQGNPMVLSGGVFAPADFQRKPMPPHEEFLHVVQFVDTAAGKSRQRGDFFVDVTLGVRPTPEGEQVWVMDVERARFSAPEQERAVVREYNEHTELGHAPDLVCIEDTGEGTALYQRLVAETRLPLRPVRPVKSKEFRAVPLSAAYRAGKVFHPENARWLRAFEAELEAFPNGPHDDQVDAAAGAYQQSGTAGPRLRVLSKSAPRGRLHV